jgi:hypothetical protein
MTSSESPMGKQTPPKQQLKVGLVLNRASEKLTGKAKVLAKSGATVLRKLARNQQR